MKTDSMIMHDAFSYVFSKKNSQCLSLKTSSDEKPWDRGCRIVKNFETKQLNRRHGGKEMKILFGFRVIII